MRFAKYFDKDLYSKWHRLWDGIAMCDVDSVEICGNKGCWKPLAIIEHLFDTNSDKKKVHEHCRTDWTSSQSACFFGLL